MFTKKTAVIIISLLIAFLLCACDTVPTVSNTPSVVPSESTAPTETYEPAPSGKEFAYDQSGNVIQQSEEGDYSLMWWRDGFNKGGKQQMNFRTGSYGLAVNTYSGKIMHLGAMPSISQAQAAQADNAAIEQLDGITTGYFAFDDNGKEYAYTSTNAIDAGFVTSRILETGQYVSRMDVMKLNFDGLKNISGRVEIASMPDYIALELGMFSPDEKRKDLGAGILINVPSSYNVVYTSDRAVTFSKESGEGFSVVIPSQAKYEINGGKLTVRMPLSISKNDIDGLSIILLPSINASGQDAVNYIAGEQVDLNAVDITGEKSLKAKLDKSKGYWAVNLGNISSYRNYNDNDTKNIERVKFTVSNPTNADISMPIQFFKEGNDFAVEGVSCMLRDAQTQEPTGKYVQICRNWHQYTTDKNGNYAAKNNPIRIWSGMWIHCYTVIDIPAGKTVTYEFNMIYTKWGTVFACSHSQLCLAGWGGLYQQWETSTVGSFSDSFCYDIEKAHGTGAAINDILPLLSYGIHGTTGQKYRWPNGVSGSDFFALYDENGTEIPLKQLTTRFIKQGPCINEVVYSGITKDESVKVDIKVNMSRTNDAAKAIYTLKYEFLKDVEFSRLYFFSLGSDGYNTSFSKITVGNLQGGASFSLGDKSYPDGTVNLDMTNISEGYLDSQAQQRVNIDGEGLFVLQRSSQIYQPEYGEPGARMINLLSWNSVINGQSYSKPSVSIRVKKALYGAYNIPCSIVELGAPIEAGSVIKKGSTVEGIVQFIPLPTHIGEGENGYYGTDEGMLSVKGEGDEFIKNLAMYFVRGERYTVNAQKGQVTSVYPITVKTEDQQAELTLNGGTGYVAITFTGLNGYSGYQLEQKAGEQWVKVDQSVHGNDYWQCWFDASDKTYQLTYNVLCSGDPENEQTFRLIKQ